MNMRESLAERGGLITAVQYVRALARAAEGREKLVLMKRDLEVLLDLSDEIEGALAEDEA